jgi:CRISPR-associated endonuclease/helicase Cas3
MNVPFKYWAHSDRLGRSEAAVGSEWQPLADHLRGVAGLAEELARGACPSDLAFQRGAWATGMLHDIGKYAPSFQRLIRGEIKKDPGGHAARGAALAWNRRKAYEEAFAIVGHHSGMPNPNDGSGSLITRVKDAHGEAASLHADAVADCPEVGEALASLVASPKPRDLHTRMLFSCLVDADRLNSASRSLSPETLQPKLRLKSLLAYVERRASEVPDGPVKSVRARVLQDCREAGVYPGNLLSMTVPTGGGKTLASMALALQRAIEQPDKVRRIIIVIPYLSIIEQNAQVFADALGADTVFEHHSGNFERLKAVGDKFVPDDPDEAETAYRPPQETHATENWDAPIIVTTSVRFFESLFSNRPSDLRRVHNIARSVVILDEVQTLPRKFIHPLLSAMRGLAKDWNTTFVFCTATQPAFEKPDSSDKGDPRWPKGEIHEVIKESSSHFQTLQRVTAEWKLDEPLPWPEVARRMLTSGQSLSIVNLRQHARELFGALKAQAPAHPGIFHLSTRMCGAHRLATIAKIRERLKKNEPCLVASTQLIEAGVDLDFPCVFRALAPFDSIVQAAGRCDREGRLTAELGAPGGKLVVFRTEDGKTPPHEYKEATDITAAMARSAPLSVHDPVAMTRYFHRYYGDADASALGAGIEAARETAHFKKVAEEFRMITDYTQDVFVPWDDESRDLIRKLEAIGVMTRELRRKLQRYVVGLSPGEFFRAKLSAIKPIRQTDLWVCVDGLYKDDVGIDIDPSAASMVV